MQSWWSDLEQKYKELVFRLVEYINEHMEEGPNSSNLEHNSGSISSNSIACQASLANCPPAMKPESTLKNKYEDLLSELSDFKKQNLAKNQEIQRVKLNLYSKNLEYKKQTQRNTLLVNEKEAIRNKYRDMKRYVY